MDQQNPSSPTPPQPTQPGQPAVVEPATEPVPPKVQNLLEQPHAQQPLSADSHHTRQFMLKLGLLLLVLLVVIAGAVGYFLMKGKTVQPVNQQVKGVSTSAPLKETTQLTVPANWNTYTNSATGLSFKYPSTWNVSDTTVDHTVTVTLTSPNGLQLKTVLGSTAPTGKCDNDPRVVVAEQKVSAFNRELTLFYIGDQAQQTVTNAYVLSSTTACPNIPFLTARDIEMSNPSLSPMQISLGYGDKTEKNINDWQTDDVFTAKQILSSFSF